ncbi:MAG: DUF962 domain-containing protein [Acidobacteria bacterium]|nr:DUF962 domain-containing protein [Acidobacteriota bacterium]
MKSFSDFWPHYVREHSQPGTRALHFAGTSIATATACALIARRKWRLLPLAFIPGYAAAWLAHFLIEGNRPATFQHPLWSLIGDYKMVALMLTGKMDEEVARLSAEARLKPLSSSK